MKVTVVFMGPLASYTGEERAEFVLGDGAKFGDLLDRIADRFGNRFPSGLWDGVGGQFKPGVLAIGRAGDLEDRGAPLADGDEIRVVPLVGGG